MILAKLFQFFKESTKKSAAKEHESLVRNTSDKSIRKGEIGEYKINIQLDQMPKEYKHISDLLIPNPKAKSGFSQIDHVLLTPYAIFIIETKNYSGEIKGGKEEKQWNVNNSFTMMNPFYQNYGHIQSILKLINVKREEIVSIVSFTRRATFSVAPQLRKIASNDLIIYDIELTEYIHRKINHFKVMHREPRYTKEQIESMYSCLQSANIVDHGIRKAHVEGVKRHSVLGEVDVASNSGKCTTCGKPVTDKVRLYCLSNNAKFRGDVYCLEHQKTMKWKE